MANPVIHGSKASWGKDFPVSLTQAYTAKVDDSGKVFFLTGTFNVTLPSAADAGAGWNATFINISGNSTVNSVAMTAASDYVNVYCNGTAFYNAGSLAT
tara:strand:+ start:9738 stop:10034 length:297 start_codon:yes stop_codon:yes gene_type:complete